MKQNQNLELPLKYIIHYGLKLPASGPKQKK